MRYSFISAAVLAFVSAVAAADPSTDFDPMSVPTSATDSVKAGDTYTIKWTAPEKYNGTVTLKLLEGASAGSLSIADSAIATGIENSANQYAWKIPSDIETFALYGIQISWDSDPTIFQWSFPFHITSTGASSSSSSVTAAGSVSSTTSESTASTKTVQISSNASYTPSSTSVPVSETTSSAEKSSSSAAVIVVNSTTATVSAAPAATTGNTTTLLTSGSLKPTTSVTSTKASGSATGTAPATVSVSSAAVPKIVAHGGLAVLGGAILAFAL